MTKQTTLGSLSNGRIRYIGLPSVSVAALCVQLGYDESKLVARINADGGRMTEDKSQASSKAGAVRFSANTGSKQSQSDGRVFIGEDTTALRFLGFCQAIDKVEIANGGKGEGAVSGLGLSRFPHCFDKLLSECKATKATKASKAPAVTPAAGTTVAGGNGRAVTPVAPLVAAGK